MGWGEIEEKGPGSRFQGRARLFPGTWNLAPLLFAHFASLRENIFMPHPALDQTDHRPWPRPPGRWTWRQSWRDLLFAHWPVPVAAVRALVPPGLEVDTFDGATWLGIVPFRMAGVMRRPLPDLPWISAFPELNVRVYVTRDGKPGVWFLSLDATRLPAVLAARTLFHLPYYWAHIDITANGDGFDYHCLRRASLPQVQSPSPREGLGEGPAQDPLPIPLPQGKGVQSPSPQEGLGEGRAQDPLPIPLPQDEGVRSPSPREGLGEGPGEGAGGRVSLVARYRPTSPIYKAAPGTLEHWLTERYCLYALSPGGTLYRTEVHHIQWPLQHAAADFDANTISAPGGLPISGPPALLHFARRIDVVVWSPRRVTSGE